MASVKIILRTDRTNSRKEHPLWLRVTKNRKSNYITLDIELSSEQWDEKNLRVRKSHPHSGRLNAIIAQKIAEAQVVSAEMEMKDKHADPLKVKETLQGKAYSDFFVYAQRFVNNFEATDKIGSWKRAKSVVMKLRNYTGAGPLRFDRITVTFLQDYESHLAIKLKNRKNTIHANLRLIRTIINNAVREDLLPYELNPFTKFKMKTEKTQRAFLTEEELNRIESLPLHEEFRLNDHRNMYVFSSYVGGLRISDVLQLRWKNFDGEKITIKIFKTQTPLTIKVPEKALQILSFYRKKSCDGNSYIFPLLKLCPEEKNAMAIHNGISSATAYTNTDLKRLSKLAGIDKHLSFHTSRHTWATRALRRGMRIEYVSKLMGHSKIVETQIYAKIVNEELDKAMVEAFG